MATPVGVAFLGNQSVVWQPAVSPSPAAASSPPDTSAQPIQHAPSQLPTTEEELKERFVSFLEERLRRVTGGLDPYSGLDESDEADDEADNAVGDADEKKRILSVLVLALDPTSQLMDLSLRDLQIHLEKDFTIEVYFHQRFAWYASELRLIAPWEKAKAKSSVQIKTLQKSARPAADLAAQRAVPSWYGRCVLTGPCPPVQGAHVLPVRAKGSHLDLVWNSLRRMWPLPSAQGLVAKGREKTNIVPLAPTVHAVFDRFAFGLRPVTHPADPDRQTRMYLQVVFFKDIERRGHLQQTLWRFDRDGGFADLARGTQGGMSHLVSHGDIYELATTDKDRYPLPSYHFLEIQFAVHKIMAGLSGASALHCLFGGEPPAGGGPTPYDVDVPPEWSWLLEAAVDANILDVDAAERWAHAFAWRHMNHLLSLDVPLPLRPVSSPGI